MTAKLYIVTGASRGMGLELALPIFAELRAGEQETVVHPLGERFGRVAGVAGATEVGENQVILVIDTVSLFGTIEAVKA